MTIGDYVKVKDNIELDSGELTKNWAGKVTEVNDGLITIQKDAQTLDSLSDDYIKYGIEERLDEDTYVFEVKDLELSERRDTDELYQLAIQKYSNRVDILGDDLFVEELDNMTDEDFKAQFGDEEEIKDAYFIGMEEVTKRFLASPFAKKIIDTEEGDIDFIIDAFVRYALNYGGEMMEEWSTGTIDEICLDVLPRKVSMEGKFFKKIGEVLKHYFDFLVEHDFIKNKKLGNYVYKRKDAIYKASQNPANWGMAKSMMMGAVDEGIDFDNEDALKQYLNAQMFVPQSLPNTPSYERQEPIRKAKKIGRNEKVTVKYTDGKVLKDVKYKKVKNDVENGLCDLV